MNKEVRSIAEKIQAVERVQKLISSYGYRYEIKTIFREAIAKDIADNDLEVFLAVAHLDALKELELELEAEKNENK